MGSRCNLVFHQISGRFLQPLTAIKFEISVSSPNITKFCKKHPMRINVKRNCAGSLPIRHSRAFHGILKHITMKRTFGAPSFGIPYGMVAVRTAAGMACFLFLLLAFDHVALAVDTAPFSEETSNSITERKTVESILARQLALRFREMSDEELIQVLEDLLNASKPSITSQSSIPEGPFKQRIMEPTSEVKSNDNIFMDVLPSGTTSSEQKSDAEIGTGNDAQEKHKIDDVSIIGEVSLSGASTILTAPVTNWWNYYQEFWIFLFEQTKSIYQQTFPYAEVILVGICLIIGGITLAKILKSDVWKSWFMREPGEKYFFRNKMYLLSAQLFRSLLSSVTSFVRLSQQQNPSKSIKNVDTKKTSSKRIDGVKDKDLSKATTKAGKAILADNDKDLSNPIGASLDDDGDLPSIKTYFRQKRAKFKDEQTQPSSYVKTIDPSESYRTQATFQFREEYENLRNRQQELARESSGNGLAYDINYANGPPPEFHSKVPPKIENKQMQTNEKEDNDNIPETNDIGKGDSFLHRGFLWAKDADGVYVRTNGNE